MSELSDEKAEMKESEENSEKADTSSNSPNEEQSETNSSNGKSSLIIGLIIVYAFILLMAKAMGGFDEEVVETKPDINIPIATDIVPNPAPVSFFTSGYKKYIVQDGETMSSIAEALSKEYGRTVSYMEIADCNPQIKDIDVLHGGQEIRIPAS